MHGCTGPAEAWLFTVTRAQRRRCGSRCHCVGCRAARGASRLSRRRSRSPECTHRLAATARCGRPERNAVRIQSNSPKGRSRLSQKPKGPPRLYGVRCVARVSQELHARSDGGGRVRVGFPEGREAVGRRGIGELGHRGGRQPAVLIRVEVPLSRGKSLDVGRCAASGLDRPQPTSGPRAAAGLNEVDVEPGLPKSARRAQSTSPRHAARKSARRHAERLAAALTRMSSAASAPEESSRCLSR